MTNIIQEIVRPAIYKGRDVHYVVGNAEVQMRYDGTNPICKVGKPCISESGQVVCIPKRYKCQKGVQETAERNAVQVSDLKDILKTVALAGIAGVGASAVIGARNKRIEEGSDPYIDRERGSGRGSERGKEAYENIVAKPATLLGGVIGAALLAGSTDIGKAIGDRISSDIRMAVNRAGTSAYSSGKVAWQNIGNPSTQPPAQSLTEEMGGNPPAQSKAEETKVPVTPPEQSKAEEMGGNPPEQSPTEEMGGNPPAQLQKRQASQSTNLGQAIASAMQTPEQKKQKGRGKTADRQSPVKGMSMDDFEASRLNNYVSEIDKALKTQMEAILATKTGNIDLKSFMENNQTFYGSENPVTEAFNAKNAINPLDYDGEGWKRANDEADNNIKQAISQLQPDLKAIYEQQAETWNNLSALSPEDLRASYAEQFRTLNRLQVQRNNKRLPDTKKAELQSQIVNLEQKLALMNILLSKLPTQDSLIPKNKFGKIFA